MCLSVNNCCCCLTLNVGTKIIGILSTVSALVSTLVYGSTVLLDSELSPGRLWFYSSMAVIALMQCVFGFFLIYGAYAHKPKHTVPWTVLTWSQSVVLLVLAVTGTALLIYNQNQHTTTEISIIISIYLLYALILFYFALVVNSRRQQMINRRPNAGVEEPDEAPAPAKLLCLSSCTPPCFSGK